MPVDLLSDESILASIREALIADTCKDVRVIGWLYQFYISKKKDQVMVHKRAAPKETRDLHLPVAAPPRMDG